MSAYRWRAASPVVPSKAPMADQDSRRCPPGSYPEPMFDLDRLDIDEIATVIADQNDYEHCWLIDPRTDQLAFWTTDTGIDGQNPTELDELDLTPHRPHPQAAARQLW